MRGHRFFDHTGDFGVDLWAEGPDGLFEESALAFVELLTDAVGAVALAGEREFEVEGIDDIDLLVALGNELLYLFEVEGWLAGRLEVRDRAEGWLACVARGEPFDPERHPIARPLKAVTHHGAALGPHDAEWRARLIFDL